MTEMTHRPVAGPAMPIRQGATLRDAREGSRTPTPREGRQILRLSPHAWERVAWRRTPLLRVLFGVAPKCVAWREVLAVPSYVPPTAGSAQ